MSWGDYLHITLRVYLISVVLIIILGFLVTTSGVNALGMLVVPPLIAAFFSGFALIFLSVAFAISSEKCNLVNIPVTNTPAANMPVMAPPPKVE
jgi:hypothetical protein